MSKTYIASTLTRKAKPRSKDLLGTSSVITKGHEAETSGLTPALLQFLKHLYDWFGYDEANRAVCVKKDAQGLPRNFYAFGEIAAGGMTAQSQGGSADVQWIQLYPSSGQKIATIKINGVETDVYAPTGGSGGTSNYNLLANRPQIAGHTLEGNKTLAQLGIAAANHTHSQYLTTTSAASLYLSQNDAAQNYQAKITTDNKLAYSLISGTPDLSQYLTTSAAASAYQTKITADNMLAYSLIKDTPDLSAYLQKTGGTMTGRLTINDATSTKPLILNTAYSGAVSTRVDFQVGGTTVGNFEYSLDTARFKLFISDGKTSASGFAIGGTNSGARPYGIPYVVLDNVPQEIWHAGNAGDYTYDWKCKVLYTAGHIVPHTAEAYAVGIGSAPFAEVHANRWYPNKDDTTHYIEFTNGHFYVHGDLVVSGEIAAGQITA